MPLSVAAVLLGAMLLQVAPPETAAKRAPDPKAKAQAQTLLREGTKLHAKGNFRGALDKFTAAYY
jgi:hypothetical protein